MADRFAPLFWDDRQRADVMAYYRYPVSVDRDARYLRRDLYRMPHTIPLRLPADLGLTAEERQGRESWLASIRILSRRPFALEVSRSYSDSSDKDLFYRLALRFGVFVERFFRAAIRQRIRDIYFSSKASGSGPPGAGSVFDGRGRGIECWKDTEIIEKIIESLYEQLLLEMTSLGIQEALSAWFKSNSGHKLCDLCGREYRVIDFPDWVYYGTSGCDVCCLGCPIVEHPTKDLLAARIKDFIDACGFLPPSDATPILPSFTSQLRDSSHWLNVLRAYGRMGGVFHVRKLYGGSWFRALAECGALPQGVSATARGIRCLARDGHECRSLDEQKIDNWLYDMGIPHQREPRYPPHPEINPSARWRADWQVNDIFIEYFGLTGEESYDSRIQQKFALASALGLRLITIYPQHLSDLNARLISQLGSHSIIVKQRRTSPS